MAKRGKKKKAWETRAYNPSESETDICMFAVLNSFLTQTETAVMQKGEPYLTLCSFFSQIIHSHTLMLETASLMRSAVLFCLEQNCLWSGGCFLQHRLAFLVFFFQHHLLIIFITRSDPDACFFYISEDSDSLCYILSSKTKVQKGWRILAN